MAQHIIEGSGDPTTVPSDLGQHYVDTVGGNHWVSVGTSASTDWKQSNGTGGGGGASSFLDLDDTPVNYVGSAGKVVAVNAGATGTEFITVAQGAQGDQGIQGIQGIQGATGAGGSAGIQGIQGTQGDAGADGATGIQGIQGDQGSTGAAGAAGLQGIQGDQGEVGLTGTTGGQGLQGIQGDAGAAGTTGLQGIQGIQGDTGLTGGQGIQGIQGDAGATGATGDDGDGVPLGGTIGQVLKKASGADLDTLWANESGGGGGGDVDSVFGRIGGVLAVAGDYDASEITETAGRVFLTPAEKTLIATNQTNVALKLNTTLKGAALGLAELDGAGLVPASQLPAFVDDVLEFANLAAFPVTGATGKIYIALDTELIYRWSGTVYVVISSTIALGETSSTAYRGDRGVIAYDHSQLSTGNPHAVTASDLSLGNVDNTSDADKPVSTAGQTALDLKEDDLSNPITNGFVLSSTTLGVRTWVAPDSGPQGIQGDTGATGTQGIQGEVGAAGSTGGQGLQGIQGDAGAAGTTGLQGIQGIQGDAGAAGSIGLQGIQGLQGDQGDTGATGSQGIQGVQGDAGADGANGSQGIQGIQGNTGSVGGQGVQGTAGSDGADGLSVISGNGVPSGGLGVDGDSYVNTSNGDTYLKALGSWALDGGNLTGPQGITGTTGDAGADGTDGASFLSGIIVPTGGIGVDGDSYADTITGITYLKTGGSWFIQGDLMGPDGLSFFQGGGTPTAGLGEINDSYLDTLTGDLYLKTGISTWVANGSLLGPQGDQGDTGSQGVTGNDGADSVEPGPTGPAGADGTDIAPDLVITTGVDVKATTQVYSDLTALVDGANIAVDCADGNVHAVTLAGNRTLDNPTNLKPGATYIFLITQDGTGSRTLSFGSAYKFPEGTAPTLTTTAAAVDIISAVSDGTNLYCSFIGDFS